MRTHSTYFSAHVPPVSLQILALLGVGIGTGFGIARTIKITDLPQMVAGFHSLVGFAAAAASIANVMVCARAAAVCAVQRVLLL